MNTWKVCVYLSDNEERIDDIDALDRRPVPPTEHPAHEFWTRPYSAMINAGWEEYEPSIEETKGYSLRKPNHPHKKFLQKAID